MTNGSFSAGEVLGNGLALLREQAGRALFAVGLLSALAIVIDQRPNSGLLGLAPFFASIYFQYELTRGALDARGLLPDGYRTRRLGALLGLCLLTQFVILLGFLFLIVPGIFLLVRWFLCVPILVREEAGILESLQLSWEETKGRFVPLLGVVALIYGPAIIVSIGAAWLAAAGSSFIAGVVANVLNYAALVVGWHAAVAAYAMRRSSVAGLTDVFA